MDKFEPLHRQHEAFFTEGAVGAGRHNFFAFHMNTGAIAAGAYRDVDWQELVDRQQRSVTASDEDIPNPGDNGEASEAAGGRRADSRPGESSSTDPSDAQG